MKNPVKSRQLACENAETKNTSKRQFDDRQKRGKTTSKTVISSPIYTKKYFMILTDFDRRNRTNGTGRLTSINKTKKNQKSNNTNLNRLMRIYSYTNVLLLDDSDCLIESSSDDKVNSDDESSFLRP